MSRPELHGSLELDPAAATEAAAAAARSCPVMGSARRLAESATSPGYRLTPGGALRPADVPAAAGVLGLAVGQVVRRAADLPVVHRAWLTAVAAGLVAVESAVATTSEVARSWSAMDDEAVRSGWLAGLRAVCADLSDRRRPESAIWSALATLEALQDDLPAPDTVPIHQLWHRVHARLTHDDYLTDRIDSRTLFKWLVPPGPRDDRWTLFTLLEQFGAVAGEPSAPRVTALGRWAAARLRAEVPVQITADWPASEVLARLVEAEEGVDLWRLARLWVSGRTPVEVARALLTAAAGTEASTRATAVALVEDLGEVALPVWAEMVASADLGPHARDFLACWERGPELGPDDERWLRMERAAAALPAAGPDEALSCLFDGYQAADAGELVAEAAASGHPQAAALARALTSFVDSGAPRAMDQLIQVKVSLAGWRPATWRRVVMPATDSLGGLSWAISVLFGWGGDHLHVFRIGERSYSDPYVQLEGTGDEDEARLARLFRTGVTKIEYTYDLGACWRHEIVLEKLLPRTSAQATLQCLEFVGDSPVEYPEEDMDEDMDEDPDERRPVAYTRPFRLDRVNATFTSRHYVVDEEFDEELDRSTGGGR